MTKRSVRTAIVISMILGIIAAAALLSWMTTSIYWISKMPTGEWVIRVQDSDGTALPDASLTLVSTDGEDVSIAKGAEGPFDNYSTPGSVCADDNGILRLQSTRSFLYGGSFWDLFWIWRIGLEPRGLTHPILVRISAPGYASAEISFDVFWSSEKEITVELKPSD